MKTINHVNYKDQDGNIYCCLRNKIVKLDDQQRQTFCNGCSMFAGTAGGKGVECMWDDMRNVDDPHIVTDPLQEFFRNQVRHVSMNYLNAVVVFCG